jgi:CPA2 family monovalent cation:H+ antiporter-2
MPDTALLKDLLIVFGMGVAMVVLFHRLNLPSVLGFLITGVVLGPYGFKIVEETHAIEGLAEIGLVLLLFEAGIEFSVKTFMRLKKFLLIAGTLQIGLTIAAAAAIAHFAQIEIKQAIFIGMLVSLSSTALVIRLLEARGELEATHGRAAMSILIFQDLCIVPMVLLTPYLAGNGTGSLVEVGLSMGKALAFVAFAGTAARFAIPWLLSHVASIQKREAFVLSIMLLCLGTAFATSHFGLSMALGAFIAGLVISDSKFSHQALAEVLPIREILNCLVFVSIGMLFDVRVLVENPLLVLGLVVLLMSIKTVVTFGATFVMGHSWRVALLTGVTLAQASEFSFVLAKLGFSAGIINAQVNQLILAVAILSMFFTPAAISLAESFQKLLDRLVPASWGAGRMGKGADTRKIEDHTIVVGYGVAGRNLVNALTSRGIPYMIVEYDPALVRSQMRAGANIIYGDASRPEVLNHAGLMRARNIVFTLSDPDLLLAAVALAHRLNPRINIIARARRVSQIAALQEKGAQSIVTEELSGSMAISAQILALHTVPENEIEETIRAIHK